jgi:Histidine kinase-, DNA gyrase B-, and HSP90-like ATPase
VAKARAGNSSSMRVEAAPEKRFFISMLVKDIELLPAIVDLVDNSIDAARDLKPEGDYSGLKVTLDLSPTEFRIVDNCGGIPVDIARHYAFRFGRPEDFVGIEDSVGQFGVGMKRALFKLGDYFRIESTAATSRFSLEVNVPEWAADTNPDWSFEFEAVEEHIRTRKAQRGTTIIVRDLHPSVGADFTAVTTGRRLAVQLSLQHQSALSRGLQIMVNGERLKPTRPALLESDIIKPINYTTAISANGSEVQAQIIAGIAVARSREDATRDDERAEDFVDPGEAGWYVFCNERLVLAADKTRVTGWGSAAAAYHPQYRRFRGYAFLQARNSALLPWNTTKTGLDQDSPVFRAVQQRMFAALQNVQAALNRLKSEASRPDEGPITSALEAARSRYVLNLPESKAFVAPPPPPPPPRTPPPRVANVNYSVGLDAMERAMDATGLRSYRDVGRYTFDYYLRNEVDADDA